MPADTPQAGTMALAGLSARYPEKTAFLGQVFNDTTNSYKLFWFLGALSLLQEQNSLDLPIADILNEMVAVAWHPVCLYRLTLGAQDKLQDAIRAIQLESKLPPDAKIASVRSFVAGSPPVKAKLSWLKRYVVTRFLSPWFRDELVGLKDSEKDRRISKLAKESQYTNSPTPYWLDGEQAHFNSTWRLFLLENLATIKAFAEYHLAQYLQARNPNVPGVINKLTAPTERDLAAARKFWRLVRAELGYSQHGVPFADIYSGAMLNEDFSIDHFLPWSFVAHDQLWNLVPVEKITNSKKGDALPDLHLYLPRLVRLHFRAIHTTRMPLRALQDHAACFKVDAASLLALPEDELREKYRQVLQPQVQIAIDQGFPSPWAYKN